MHIGVDLKSKGMRILDKKNGNFIVELPDILKLIQNGDSLQWSVLVMQGTVNPGEGAYIGELADQMDNSKNGLFLNWNELNSLSHKFFQIIDGVFIGCKDEKFLRRYETDQEMYESCDVVIVMFDSSYWEIFTKDEAVFKRLAEKFEVKEYLETDFQKEFEN